jgi:hypothetical protein
MRNIHWLKGDGSMAFTLIANPEADSRVFAMEAQARGDFPADWRAVAFDDEAPPMNLPQETWAWNGQAIVLNVAEAVKWHKARLRAERTPLLAALDVQFMRALESGQDTMPIVAEKQRLRDATAAVDGLQTWNEMAAVKL